MLRMLILPAIAVMAIASPVQADQDGRSRAELLSCAGAPQHTERRGAVEYFYYSAPVATDILPAGAAAAASDDRCETVVVLVDGQPAAAEYRTSPDLLRAQACSPQVNQCIN